MPKKSAGILVYRFKKEILEVLLVHPGGPFWEKKDNGAWSIPKGEFNEDEDPLKTAKREFFEETGFNIKGEMRPMTPIKQPSKKLIYAWAVKGDLDTSKIKSNNFTMEWPPHSGKQSEFPEIDQASWFPVVKAYEKILRGQRGFIDQLIKLLGLEEAIAIKKETISKNNNKKNFYTSN